MTQNECKRLATVKRYLNLEISKRKELQDIVNTAAEICETPTALITLVDDHTQYIKFKVGFDMESTPRQEAFCNHAIEQHDVMLVHDALDDDRFKNNKLVTHSPFIRFYAGSPLTTQDGFNLGTLCVIDQKPKQLNRTQHLMLRILSKQVTNLLEFDSSLNMLKQQFVEAKQAEIKLRSFFESCISNHLLIGKNQEVIDYNQSLAHFVHRVFGVQIICGMQVSELVSPSYLAEFIENYKRALAGKAIRDERLVKYETESIWWLITFEPARDPDGHIIGVSYNAMDITQRVEYEQMIIKQNETLRKITQVQSHEIRRPVASILGLMNVIKMSDYRAGKEELMMMEDAVNELDEKIRFIVNHAN